MKENILQKIKSALKKDHETFLKKVKGIVHVGANTGQEISLYAKYGLPVVWIEPIPTIFETLKANVKGVHNQIALEGLVTNVNGAEYEFHLASNNGASSSIFEFNLHKDIWPDVSFQSTIKLYSKTLPALLNENNINLHQYDTLIMDTQGSELLVLQGAISILQNFNFIKTEVPDFESYKGCCQLKDLQLFFEEHGYKEFSRNKFANHPSGGSYYDIIYRKASAVAP